MDLRVAIGIVFLALVCVGGYLLLSHTQGQTGFPELTELAGHPEWTFQDLSTYFRKLAEEKGAVYAFQVLLIAQIPPNTDLHLLAHVVGDVLYKQQGLEGIHVCTQDFRNACSHSVVIGFLREHGEGSLPEIVATCKKAPGGKGAYTMCFHGLGHGVLAFNEYHFDKAVEMCKKTGSKEYQEREYIECVGGATMEMIAGVHDRDAWKKQLTTYFKKSDPLYPCNADFMSPLVRPICYIHLTPYLFDRAGIDLGKPDPELYGASFAFCDLIPREQAQDRDACYSGFGKEFIVLAQDRDVRDIGSMKASQLTYVRSWCKLAGDEQGERVCNLSALGSLFWGGENNPEAAFTFCEIAEGQAQGECYSTLSSQISFYLSGDMRQRSLCERLPESFRQVCLGGR